MENLVLIVQLHKKAVLTTDVVHSSEHLLLCYTAAKHRSGVSSANVSDWCHTTNLLYIFRQKTGPNHNWSFLLLFFPRGANNDQDESLSGRRSNESPGAHDDSPNSSENGLVPPHNSEESVDQSHGVYDIPEKHNFGFSRFSFDGRFMCLPLLFSCSRLLQC